MKTIIRKDNHLVLKLCDQCTEGIISHISSVTVPIYHKSELVQDKAKFTANDPTFVGFTFLANLPGRSSFPDRMNQLNTISIGSAKECMVSSPSSTLYHAS